MRSWRNSWVTRLSALVALMVVAVVMLSGWLRDRASRTHFLQDQRGHLAHRMEVIKVRVQSAIDGVCKDVLFLSRMPSVARLALPDDGAGRAQALGDAAVIFRSLLEVRPTYFQARFIGVEDGGREVIRLEQDAGRIREVPAAELQRKGDRDYFQETMKLEAGRFYLSEINLNQEYGRIHDPHVPTLRASMAVEDPSGRRAGMVILNVDVGLLFREIRDLAGPEVTVLLCNAQGDYLMHPDASRCFGFDLGRRHRIMEDFPELATGEWRGRFGDDDAELSLMDAFAFTWGTAKSLVLRLGMAKGPLLEHLQARRAQNMAWTALFAVAAGGVVIGVTNLVSRRLRRLAEAVERYQPGSMPPELPEETPDEVGVLTRTFGDLAKKVSDQMQELREARERAEEAVRLREEFLATMSHEIRTPMNAVLGLAQLLEGSGLEPAQRERLRTLQFAGRHLMALLNNLLDRDRIASGEIVLERSVVDLESLLENLHRSFEALAGRKALALKLDVRPGVPPRVSGDGVRLYQVLNNLMHNAVKFTQRGEVVLRVSVAEEGRMRFEVSDTGPGLPEGVLQQGRGGLAGTEGGGLGLWISRRLIELMGGQLEAQSGPSGTTLSFRLALPAVEGQAAIATWSAPPDLSDYDGLMVEDVASNQTVLGEFLRKTGLRLEGAMTGADARRKAVSGQPDFAFVDVQLPDVNGLDLARDFRRLDPRMRVMVVTAQVTPEIRAACRESGVREFVAKPIDAGDLYAKLWRLTVPRVDAVVRMFDGEPAKVRGYLDQLEREWACWREELEGLKEKPDAQALSRLHHRMKNALGQLELWKLDRTLGELGDAMRASDLGAIQELSARALRLLSTAAQLTGENRLSSCSL